jgi:anthranilate synthase component 1
MLTPTREEFRRLAGEGNLIPVCREVVADLETPVSAYRKIAFDQAGRARPYSFLLESVEGGENIARYSFLGVDPFMVFVHRDGRGEVRRGDRPPTPVPGTDVFAQIHEVLAQYRPVKLPGLPPFTGGAVGYAAYDVVSEVEPSVVQPAKRPFDVPEALFMITDTILVFDRVRHTIKIIAQAHLEDGSDPDAAYTAAAAKIEELSRRLAQPLTLPPVSLDDPAADLPFTANKTPAQYMAMVERTKRHIHDGDIIQAVQSQRFELPIDVSPFSVHRSLRMLNPSPYMFLLQCGDFALVGASPEVHAKCIGRKITVRPIAGTRKRGATPEADDRLEEELLADPKERAEHIMLVDLARNDIGRIAEPGSVQADQLMTVERYSHVMHIVSNVTGILREGLGADAVMRATFPAGTLSGAPKIRAMQIIGEQEGERRGPYGGAVAYYSFDGNVNSCITIRTALLKDRVAYVQVGAGIVADSVPETEHEECRSKARAMLRALAIARHFEPEGQGGKE